MTLKLDHFVVHIDNDEKILSDLKGEIEPLGFPFEPQWGKGTKGFKAANIWIGRQYFEIIRLLRPDGGGWVPKWIKRHSDGIRGLYCIFIATKEIEKIASNLKISGLQIQGPERITFKAFFGLIKKTLPWRLIYLPPIPGTNLEIGFIQYDPDPSDRIKQYLVPNSDERGITGVSSARVHLPLSDEARTYLQKLFPGGASSQNQFEIPLSSGHLIFEHQPDKVHVTLFVDSKDSQHPRGKFQFLNVAVQT
jgi:hypothetical protein